MEMYNRPGVRLRMKARMRIDEVAATSVSRCVSWNPSNADYDRLRLAHHPIFLRCLCSWKRKREDHAVSCANALAKTDSESIEAMARRLRIFIREFCRTHGRGAPAEEGDVSVGGKR